MMRNFQISMFIGAMILSVPLHASVVNFEATPGGGTPTDDGLLGLAAAYSDGSTSVTMGFDTNNDMISDVEARFEARYSIQPTCGVNGYTSNPAQGIPQRCDYDATGGTGGDWLLREPKEIGVRMAADLGGDDFIINYSGVLPNSASGEIWDVDFFEDFTVDAFNAGGTLIASTSTGVQGDPGNNEVSTTFVFNNLAQPIAKIRISLGPLSGGLGGGFAFDNFNATAIPEPASLSLLAMGGLFLVRRRR